MTEERQSRQKSASERIAERSREVCGELLRQPDYQEYPGAILAAFNANQVAIGEEIDALNRRLDNLRDLAAARPPFG
jgi:hypothetical protein